MAKKEDTKKIPIKFRNTDKSFIENISKRNDQSFISFPRELKFHGKEKEENVILIVRSHWIAYVPTLFFAIFVLILPFLLTLLIPSFSTNLTMLIALIITATLICLGLIVSTFVKWFYTVHIITDQRVLDLDFASVLNHSMSEAQLEKIEDITHKQLGVIGSLFDIGSVYIQTAGANAEIEFQNIPRPRDVQDILIDLLELKQKGEI